MKEKFSCIYFYTCERAVLFASVSTSQIEAFIKSVHLFVHLYHWKFNNNHNNNNNYYYYYKGLTIKIND